MTKTKAQEAAEEVQIRISIPIEEYAETDNGYPLDELQCWEAWLQNDPTPMLVYMKRGYKPVEIKFYDTRLVQ